MSFWAGVDDLMLVLPSAGSDTGSCALQSFVYHMTRHPSAWQTARDEVLRICPDTIADRVVSHADAVKLPYLQACIKEALRIFSPVPMGLPRVAPREGISIGGRWFSAGTTLSVFPPGLHLSREIWGEDAQEFRPERWLRHDAGMLEGYFIPVSISSYSFNSVNWRLAVALGIGLVTSTDLVVHMQWGLGYNSCPGQKLARIELSKITATLVRDYDIRPVDPSKQWQYKSYFTVTPTDWPVYVTKKTMTEM